MSHRRASTFRNRLLREPAVEEPADEEPLAPNSDAAEDPV